MRSHFYSLLLLLWPLLHRTSMQGKRAYSPPKPYGSQPKRQVRQHPSHWSLDEQTPVPPAIRSMPNPHKVLAARLVPPAAAGVSRVAQDAPSRLPQPMPVRELPRFGSQKPAAASLPPVRGVAPSSPPQQEVEARGVPCSRLGSSYKMVLSRNDSRSSNLLQITCTIDMLLVGSVGKGIMEVFGGWSPDHAKHRSNAFI